MTGSRGSILVVGHPTLASRLDGTWETVSCETTGDAVADFDSESPQPVAVVSAHAPPAVDCFRLIRAVEPVPVVLMTTNGSSELATAAFRNGAAGYLDLDTVDDETRALTDQLEELVEPTTSTTDAADADSDTPPSPKQDERQEFINIMSHELRTPVQKAKSGLDLIAADCDSDYIEKTRAPLDRLEELLDELLSVVRYGETVPDTHPVDVEAVVTEAWPDDPNATLTVESPLPTVDADRSRLQQICENLFRNAIEHNTGAIEVRVGTLPTQPHETTPATTGVYIADDGQGLPPEKRTQVFEYGYTDSPHGTGLGLAIVDRIVTAFGWEITLTESRDGGAQFEIREIPLADTE